LILTTFSSVTLNHNQLQYIIPARGLASELLIWVTARGWLCIWCKWDKDQYPENLMDRFYNSETLLKVMCSSSLVWSQQFHTRTAQSWSSDSGCSNFIRGIFSQSYGDSTSNSSDVWSPEWKSGMWRISFSYLLFPISLVQVLIILFKRPCASFAKILASSECSLRHAEHDRRVTQEQISFYYQLNRCTRISQAFYLDNRHLEANLTSLAEQFTK
jgi:hypothetical protein